MFTARYGLILYMKWTSCVFNGLTLGLPRAIRVALEVRRNIILHFCKGFWPSIIMIVQGLPDDREKHMTIIECVTLHVIFLLHSTLLGRGMVRAETRHSTPDQSTWDLWCTDWHRNSFRSEYFRFPPHIIIPPVFHSSIGDGTWSHNWDSR